MPWQEFVDDTSGTKYYYNAETKETTWEKPKAEPDPQWKKYDDDSGRPYYYHFGTQETVWEQPDSFVEDAEGQPTNGTMLHSVATKGSVARSRLPKPNILSATEAKVPLRPGLDIVILADSMYRGQKARLEKHLVSSAKWGCKLLGEDKRVALSADDFGVPGWKKVDESEIQDLTPESMLKNVIAPKSATKKKKEKADAATKDFKEGDTVFRKGKECRILKIDYQTHPATYVVLDVKSNQEINTEAKHLSGKDKTAAAAPVRRKAGTGPFTASQDQLIGDLAISHRAPASMGGTIFYRDITSHFNNQHPQATRTAREIQTRYEALNQHTSKAVPTTKEVVDEFFESQRVEVKGDDELWKTGTISKKHGPTIYDIQCDDGTQFLQHHCRGIREEGKGAEEAAKKPAAKDTSGLPTLEEQLSRQAVSKPISKGRLNKATGAWEHDVVAQNKDYLASILGFDAGDPDDDPEPAPKGGWAGKIDLRKYMTEGKKFECSACESWKPYNEFTKAQLNRVAKKRRCNKCIMESNVKVRCSECGTTDKSKFMKSVINMKASGKIRCLRCSKQYEQRFNKMLAKGMAGHGTLQQGF